MIKSIKNAIFGLKSFSWKLFISLCLAALVPAIYQTVRAFIISTNTSVEGIDVIGQMEWFDLINETILAFLVVPLYSIFNKIADDKQSFSKMVFKLGCIVFAIYLCFQLGVFIYADHLVKGMNPEQADINTITQYLRMETLAFMTSIIYSIANVVFIVMGKSRNVYALLVVNAITLVISDFLLVPAYGVMGVAYSNILSNLAMGVISIVLLAVEKAIAPSLIRKDDMRQIGHWAKTGLFAGAQQLVDNLIYAVMVVKMVNMVAEQGNYWVANNFIWGWMLIPITALGEVIKRDAKDYGSLKQSNYYLIVAMVAIIWAISIPAWNPFYQYAEGLQNHNDIFLITLGLFPFYIAYAICVIPDSIFIGLGKTQYNAINSLLINLGYYGLFYILYKTNAVEFNMTTIVLMFGFGMLTHMVISLVEQYVFVQLSRKRLRADKANN